MKHEKPERKFPGYKTSRNASFKVSGYYLIFGAAWILLSDILLAAFSGGLEVVSVISIAKGLAFVFISSLVIYNLVFHSIQKVQLKDSKIAEKQIQIKNANDALAEAMEMNAAIIEKMMNAFALHKIILDDTGKPIDYIYLDVNPAFEEFTGIKGKKLSANIPGNPPGKGRTKVLLDRIYGDVACTGQQNVLWNILQTLTNGLP